MSRLLFFLKFKETCTSFGKYGLKAAECPDKKTESSIAGEIKVDFRASASSVAHGATEQSFARKVLA